MIDFYNEVPTVYNHASRDFQYLSWLINIVLNSVKHNVDDLYNLPNTKADPRITELLAMTLGFKIKRNYDQKQLATLVSIIPTILKYKGTITALELAGKALITASGAIGVFKCEFDEIDKNCLKIVLPKELVDTTLFMDLLPYILPAGITCKVIRKTEVQAAIEVIDLEYRDILTAEFHEDISWDADNQNYKGLAVMFDADRQDVHFANFVNTEDDTALNSGLLSNNIIPTLLPADIESSN